MEDGKPSLDELIHFGKKGMRWGVRNVHLAKVEKATKRLDAVASGTATKRQVLGTALNTPIPQLVTKGLKGSSAANSAALKAHAARIETGNMKIRDGLAMYGSLSVSDLVKAGRVKR